MDALPNPNPPHFSGLGTGTELHWLVPSVAWFSFSESVKGNLRYDIILSSTTSLNESNDQEAVVNQDDIGIDDDNNEGQREISRHSTWNKKAPETYDFITGNRWGVDEALCSCVDDVMGEPRTLAEALESPDKSK